MRVALVSDIHGNLTALEALIADIERRAPDAVVHGGDLVLMGAEAAQVVDRVRELGWPGVVGNTDELLWRPEERERQEQRAPKLSALLDLLFDQYAPATRELLGDDRLAWLRDLPADERLGDLLVLHATPDDLWRAPMPDATDAELSDVYGGCGAAEVVYGHIHRPYVRVLGPLTVANCGSVGLPWDGDPRASYLLIDDGEPRVMRVEYDVEREAAALERSGYPDAYRLAEMRRRARYLPPGWSEY
jgi:predicted phosphodiesterase